MGKILNTIAGMGATMVAGFSGYQMAEPNIIDYLNPREVAESIEQYPEEIDGAWSVDKYQVKGSKYVLVHVKQYHYSPFTFDEEQREAIVGCQNDIIDIFKDIEGKENILAEGNPSYVPKLEHAKHEAEKYDRFNKMGVAFATDEETQRVKDKLERYERSLKQGRLEAYDNLTATDILQYQDEATVYCGEKDELNEKRHEEVLNGGIGEWNQKAEDLVLEYATQFDDEVVYTVYGSGHSFRDNVDRWNEDHPDSMISLIEITPNTIERYESNNTKSL